MLPQISGQMMPYQPKTFEELLEKSKLVEKALIKTAREGEHAHFTAETEVSIKLEKTRDKAEDCSKSMEQMTKTFSETMAKVMKTNAQSRGDWNDYNRSCHGSYRGGQNKRHFDRDETRSTPGKPKCFVCGRVGHIAKVCRERRDKSDNQQ